MLLRAEREGIYVDTRVRSTRVVLVGLDEIKVSAFTLREAVLAVKLELSSYYGVLTPAVHVKGSLREHERAGIRDTRVLDALKTKAGLGVFSR